jgi:hypothetical protein
MPQTLGNGSIRFSGSPYQTSFGEKSGHGYSLVTVERGRPPIIEHRQVPSRELITIHGEWADDPSAIAWDRQAMDIPKGASVRLQYDVGESNRTKASEDAEATRQMCLNAGARSVKLDPRITSTTRVRSEKIRTAKTTAEKIEALWEARGERPERSRQILDKLTVLEQEVPL